MNNYYGSNLIKGDNVKIGRNVIIEDNVTLEENVTVGDFVKIKSNVTIRRDTFIGDYCIIGEVVKSFYKDESYVNPVTIIGEKSLIRSNTIIYCDNKLNANLETGHRVTIREKSVIGKNVRIGTLSDIQGYCEIGDYVNMHSNVHIGQKSKIADYVWIFPYTILTNDPTPPSFDLLGVNVEKFAIIATGSIILPGINIGENSLVGAKSLVRKDVERETVVAGNPAKTICNIRDIKNKITKESVYPWQYYFDRGMPWQEIGYKEWRNLVEDYEESI